jgi:hypothetical protein
MNEFEKKLQRQPVRRIPAEWRADILRAARAEADPRARRARPSWLSTLHSRFSTLLWPCPQGWGALAAVWLVIAVWKFYPSEAQTIAQDNSHPPKEVQSAFFARQRDLSQLLDSFAPAAVLPAFPAPRSDRRRETAMT